MEEIIKALQLKEQLDALRPIDKEQEARIMQKFRLDWNYHSNNLEGNSLTYGETKALLMHGITAQGKPLKDHFEVTGHNEAIEWVTDVVKGDYPLTQNFIRELHTLLLKESFEVDAITTDFKPTKKRIGVGKYKSSPNHVQTKTGDIFYFATPEETPAKMNDLMLWYNEKIEDVNFNPILLAAEFHYKFIRIHPFDDGNGRTARILMNFILMKFGCPPVIIKTDDKANYFVALQLADTGNIEPFVNYIAKNLNRSLEIMIAGAQGESIEEPDDIDKEIDLLEKRLKTLGTRTSENQKKQALIDLFDNTITALKISLDNKVNKFSNFYNEIITHFQITREDILINGTTTSTKSIYLFDKCREELSESTKVFSIVITYKKFNRFDFSDFDFFTIYNFDFLEKSYVVWSNKARIERVYGTQLTVEEINNVINSGIKTHTDFLQYKISEKEKGE